MPWPNRSLHHGQLCLSTLGGCWFYLLAVGRESSRRSFGFWDFVASGCCSAKTAQLVAAVSFCQMLAKAAIDCTRSISHSFQATIHRIRACTSRLDWTYYSRCRSFCQTLSWRSDRLHLNRLFSALVIGSCCLYCHQVRKSQAGWIRQLTGARLGLNYSDVLAKGSGTRASKTRLLRFWRDS
jgi:hypothetical protein